MLTTHIDDNKGSATAAECKILLRALKKDYGDDAKIEKMSVEELKGIKRRIRSPEDQQPTIPTKLGILAILSCDFNEARNVVVLALSEERLS